MYNFKKKKKMETPRFVFQENQFFGDCISCTAAVFNQAVDSPKTAYKISTRREIDKAISEGMLDTLADCPDFKQFCLNKETAVRAGKHFAQLSLEDKLKQWANLLKQSSFCFIFGVGEFEAVAKTDKNGDPVLDKDGQPVVTHPRKQKGIVRLSGLFMFDADHLPLDPREVFERTLVPGFAWQVRLAHVTSSGHGLRLVCEVRPELGNIADNQIELARDLGLLGMVGTTGKPVADDSCIDATRISYCPRREDIYYIDEDHLFKI